MLRRFVVRGWRHDRVAECFRIGHRSETTGAIGCIDRGEARPFRVGHLEAGVGHSERREDALAQKDVERHPGGDLDHPPKDIRRQTVMPLGTWLAQEWRGRELVDVFRQAACGHRQAVGHAGRPIGRADGAAVQKPVTQPGPVGQQVANRDVASGGNEIHRASVYSAHDSLGLERRNVFRHRIGQLQLAFLIEHHHRDTRDRLRHRRDAEDRVRTHRPVAPDILEPDRVHVGNLAVARDERHDAARLVPVDERLHAAMHAIQPFARDADAVRGRRREWRRLLRTEPRCEQ